MASAFEHDLLRPHSLTAEPQSRRAAEPQGALRKHRGFFFFKKSGLAASFDK
jgi:hypothetical protein